MNIRTKFLIEVAGKNALVVAAFVWLFFPWVLRSQREFPTQAQGSVLAIIGLLMAASIIGAFEMSYQRTNLAKAYQRYLAHVTKFTLYVAISLLMLIALGAMGATPGFFNDPIAFASILVAVSLFLYDFWDALRACDEHSA